MAPKPKTKDTFRKTSVIRQAISNSSLVRIPEGAVDGFEDRINSGIDWTDIELAGRHHRKLCKRQDKPTVTFSQGLKNKIKYSVLGGFLQEDSNISLEQQWELILPITLWDNEKFANEESKACFNSANCITDDIMKMITKTVKNGDRKTLQREIKMVEILRVNDVQMTELDKGLHEFKKLVSLNLCGNFIRNLDAKVIPSSVKTIELQSNGISNVQGFAEYLPKDLLYLGLAKNLLTDESTIGMGKFPYNLMVLDLSDNDIYYLDLLLNILATLPNLVSLQLEGNPCSVSAAYALSVVTKLPRLKWLDSRELLPTDKPLESIDIHPDDLRSTYFHFTVFRIISAPQPPKTEKGAITTFHVELEIPLLDATRRRFLMFRRNESLVEMLPSPEDWSNHEMSHNPSVSKAGLRLSQKRLSLGADDESTTTSNIYNHLEVKNSLEIKNYTTFESNRVQYNKIMNFQEPTVKIFCPNLVALRDTFRSAITVKLIYSVTYPRQTQQKKSAATLKTAQPEQRVVLATIRCKLKNPNWSQPSQHFHWDDTLGTNDAIHWGDGDLSVLQYGQPATKVTKGKQDGQDTAGRQHVPENITCHFGFGIDTIRAT